MICTHAEPRWPRRQEFPASTLKPVDLVLCDPHKPSGLVRIYNVGGTAGSVVPSCVFRVRNLRGMAKGEQDARRGSVFDL